MEIDTVGLDNAKKRGHNAAWLQRRLLTLVIDQSKPENFAHSMVKFCIFYGENLHMSKKSSIFATNFTIHTTENDDMPSSEVQNMIPIIRAFFQNQPVERAYLFGSCSRGEETKDSDVDLLVTYTDSDSLSLLDISRMMVTLSKQLKRKVDLVEEAYLKPFAKESVNRDKIMIYERTN